jgi:hypothetical protein
MNYPTNNNFGGGIIDFPNLESLDSVKKRVVGKGFFY